MSPEHEFVFLADLSPEVLSLGVDDATALLFAAVADLADVDPGGNALPSFGEAFSYDASRFRDVSGVAVVDGRALVGISPTNLDWPHRDSDRDESFAHAESRLDLLLRRLSRLTVGPPGEVAGAVSNEHMNRFFEGEVGAPVVRCRDGLLRVVWVTPPHGGRRALDDAPVPLPEVIPVGLVVVDEGPRLAARMDGDALLRRCAALDLAAAEVPSRIRLPGP